MYNIYISSKQNKIKHYFKTKQIYSSSFIQAFIFLEFIKCHEKIRVTSRLIIKFYHFNFKPFISTCIWGMHECWIISYVHVLFRNLRFTNDFNFDVSGLRVKTRCRQSWSRFRNLPIISTAPPRKSRPLVLRCSNLCGRAAVCTPCHRIE